MLKFNLAANDENQQQALERARQEAAQKRHNEMALKVVAVENELHKALDALTRSRKQMNRAAKQAAQHEKNFRDLVPEDYNITPEVYQNLQKAAREACVYLPDMPCDIREYLEEMADGE